MSRENVKRYFETIGLGERMRVLEDSSATVEQAAAAIGCEIKQIAKTLAFLRDESPILVVAAGHARVDNKKYRTVFGEKPKMVPARLVKKLIGHSLGGICPFAVKPDVAVYLDESLRVNEVVYSGAGDGHSIVELSLEELKSCSNYKAWVDVCR